MSYEIVSKHFKRNNIYKHRNPCVSCLDKICFRKTVISLYLLDLHLMNPTYKLILFWKKGTKFNNSDW